MNFCVPQNPLICIAWCAASDSFLIVFFFSLNSQRGFFSWYLAFSHSQNAHAIIINRIWWLVFVVACVSIPINHIGLCCKWGGVQVYLFYSHNSLWYIDLIQICARICFIIAIWIEDSKESHRNDDFFPNNL